MKKENRQIKRDWYIADAKDQILGRFASKIAGVLYGKSKENFMPNVDQGDYVVVINARDVKVTGRKKENKTYFRHTGYPGGLKKETLKELLEGRPEEVIKRAVRGMLKDNKIAKEALKRLRVYRGAEYLQIKESLKELK